MNEFLYELGKKAKDNDHVAMIKIIKSKERLIRKMSKGDEDCYQFILEKLVKGIKNYNFNK